jgi:probable phosphoglycerate mutase
MIFYYVRHGDPIYNPDSLTPLGKRQAEACAKLLCRSGLDEIYSSTSQRAIDTATPTAEILKKEIKLLDFAHERHAAEQLFINTESTREWISDSYKFKKIFCTPEVYSLGFRWHEHPAFKDYRFGEGMERIQTEADAFFASLGFEHDTHNGRYKVVNPKSERVALFAHYGFGMAFLSAVLDIPYPMFSRMAILFTSGVTAIRFKPESDGYAIPQILTLNSEAHLFADGLPMRT